MYVLIYGLINSFILSLLSLGFALVYSIARLPNFAHGAIYVATGYVGWFLFNRLLLPFPVAMFLALLFSALTGALIYRIVLIKVRGMTLSEVIASYAIGIAILEILRWGGLRGMTFMLPVLIPGSVEILGVSIDYQRLIIVGLSAGLLLFLYLFTHHTKIGLSFRAIAQDERASLMLGIDSDKAALLSLSMGSAFCGLAALFILPLGNIVVEAGYSTLIFALAVCVVGGLGSTAGVVAASFILGFTQTLTEKLISSHFQMVVALLAIIGILILRPSGLFGKQKELEERV
uniref:Branched-chain amino acid ABC transporter permease n=1 Tax=candidate division WOR-3 bacterium TaxID=2052148 RepID=A0A7C2P5Q5_UNCW3